MISSLEAKANLSGLGVGTFDGTSKIGKMIIGFSAGADSMSLVHFLMSKVERERIICAHVNHMLRGEEAENDERAARSFCEKNGLRFELRKLDINAEAKKRKIGTEECGRQVRYEFFESLVTSEEDRILTAHNADDNAETVLMNLTKGAGLHGLCGIPYQRGNIIRPLIDVERSEIEDYCKLYNLPYVTDSSNLANDYTRNRLRNQVFPVLKEINPNIISAVSQMTDTLKEEDAYLTAQAERLLTEAEASGGLNMEVLTPAPQSIKSRAIMLYLEKSGCMRPERGHIERIASCENGQRISVPGGFSAAVSRGILSVRKTETEDWSIVITGESTDLPIGKRLRLTVTEEQENKEMPDDDTERIRFIHKKLFNSAFDYDTISENIIARNRREGDMFTPAGRNGTKRVKKLLWEMKVPSFMRNDVTILECGGDIVFVEGAGVSERHRLTENTKRIAIIELEAINLGGEDERG